MTSASAEPLAPPWGLWTPNSAAQFPARPTPRLLPDALPHLPGFRWALAQNRDSDSHADWYFDFFPLGPGRQALFVADCRGHAPTTPAVLRAILRLIDWDGFRAPEALERLERAFRACLPGVACPPVQCAVLEASNGVVEWSAQGIAGPILLRPNDRFAAPRADSQRGSPGDPRQALSPGDRLIWTFPHRDPRDEPIGLRAWQQFATAELSVLTAALAEEMAAAGRPAPLASLAIAVERRPDNFQSACWPALAAERRD